MHYLDDNPEKFKLVAVIKEKFIDIMDKLNAIFGEAKAFIDRKTYFGYHIPVAVILQVKFQYIN